MKGTSGSEYQFDFEVHPLSHHLIVVYAKQTSYEKNVCMDVNWSFKENIYIPFFNKKDNETLISINILQV